MAYKELIDKKIGEVYQAGIATKILQHMDRIRNVSDTSQARRWVMELFQNSRDVAYEEQPVKIRIVLEDNCLSFYHNGKPFRVKDILSIVNQVSSKSSDESTIGQFGTGFMTTYQLSEVVEINAVLKEEHLPYKPFSIQIDRRGMKKEEILDGIFQTMDELKKADEEEELLTYNKDAYNTQFKYHLNHEESYRIAKTGMDDLKDTILYVLLFSEKIEQVELLYNTVERKEAVTYLRAGNSLVAGKLQKLSLIERRMDGDKIHNLMYLYENGMTLAAEMDENHTFLPLQEYTPRLFVDFPLIGAENFPFPIVINHREFKTNEPRSGITLVDNASSRDALVNKELIKQATNLYQEFLHTSVENGYGGLEAIVEIPCFSPNKEWSENWVKAHIYRKLYNIIAQEKMIETSVGKRALAYPDVFLINGTGVEKEGVKQLLEALHLHHVPVGTERWYEALQGFEIPEDKILSLSKIVSSAVDYLKNKLDENKMSAITWCRNLYFLCKQNAELSVEIKAGNIAIFPNQDEKDWSMRKLYTSTQIKKDPQIPEVLKKVSDLLDKLEGRSIDSLQIRKNLLHQEFQADTPELEIYEKMKLENHIISRSSRKFPVINFSWNQNLYENTWRQAWYLMISCCPDEEMYTLSKKMLGEKLVEWKPLNEDFGKALWKNTCVNLLTMFLDEISNCKTLLNLMQTKFRDGSAEERLIEVYEWLNQFYQKLYEFQMDNELRMKSVVPNQEGELRWLNDLNKDGSSGEELKEIAREFTGRDEYCNVYRTLMDKKIVLPEIYIHTMDDKQIASKIHQAVVQLLSETSLPDADLEYQEACTRLLSWIQEHLEEAKRYFPDFWKEEDQMRLLTPKAAVGIQKKARKLEQFLNKLNVGDIEEAEEKLKQLLLMEEQMEEAKKKKTVEFFFDWNTDVYFDGELGSLPMEERMDVLREIGLAGEKYAFARVKEYFLQQGYALLEDMILEDNPDRVRLESQDKRTMVEINYPDSEYYHQAGWDISIQIKTEAKEEFYYAEVKTHTEQSIKRGILCFSNEQMKQAAGSGEHYFVFEVICNWRQRQCTDMTYYQNPIRQIAEGKLWNPSGKYELASR